MQNLIRQIILGRYHNRNGEGGFLILDILFTLVVLGILVSQGWRSYLREVNRARELEAVVILRALNQGQIIHYIEEQQFSQSYLPGITKQSNNYNFSVRSDRQTLAEAIATPRSPNLHGYISVICYDDQVIWVKTFQGLPNQLPVIGDISCAGASRGIEEKPKLEDLVEDPSDGTTPDNPEPGPDESIKIELVCETNNTTGSPSGLEGKTPSGLANKTPVGWEVAPGINKIVTAAGCK